MTAQTDNTFPPEELSAAACAQAAAWIARLHGNGRTREVEEGFRRWLAASPEHKAAFEMANDLWTQTEHWPKPTIPTIVRRPGLGVVLTMPRALLAAAAVAALTLVGTMLYLHEPGIVTEVGEQRNITLEDGTRVALNTNTRIHVDYNKLERLVRLESGEALFDVAKQVDRPFVVSAGERRITALGTQFLVRKEAHRIAVTLMEGKVAVASYPPLTPGQRLTFKAQSPPALDRPVLRQLTAWESGQVVFDHTPLRGAIAEMNRYSSLQLVIDDAASSELEITGVFRSGDSVSFANAVAENYGLAVDTQPDRIRLTASTPLP